MKTEEKLQYSLVKRKLSDGRRRKEEKQKKKIFYCEKIMQGSKKSEEKENNLLKWNWVKEEKSKITGKENILIKAK